MGHGCTDLTSDDVILHFGPSENCMLFYKMEGFIGYLQPLQESALTN
jgi:hypothetical protein